MSGEAARTKSEAMSESVKQSGAARERERQPPTPLLTGEIFEFHSCQMPQNTIGWNH